MIGWGRKNSYRRTTMPTVEKISIALPAEMATLVRGAVETGEYASASEVVRDALREWTWKRNLRQRGIEELRRLWQQAAEDDSPGLSVDEVFDELEHRYEAMAKVTGSKK